MARRQRRRGIELGWLETLILVVGYVTTVGIVGATGIYIGQRAVKQRLGGEERFVRLPVTVSGVTERRERAAEEPPITFYEELGKAEVAVGGGEPDAAAEKPRKNGAKAAQRAETRTVAGANKRGVAKTRAGESEAAGATKPNTGKMLDGANKRIKATPLAGTKALASTGTLGAERSRSGAKGRVATQMLEAVEQGRERIVAPEGVVEANARKAGLVPQAAVRKRHDEPTTPRLGSGSEASGATVVPGHAALQVRRGVTPEAAATANALLIGDAGRGGQAPAPGLERAARSTVLNRSQGVTSEAAATARAGRLPNAPSPSPGSWSVQVNATKERALAESLLRRLSEHGYDAFIVEQTRAGSVWYRVRVGHLETLEAANTLVSDLKRREGISRAFVASD